MKKILMLAIMIFMSNISNAGIFTSESEIEIMMCGEKLSGKDIYEQWIEGDETVICYPYGF